MRVAFLGLPAEAWSALASWSAVLFAVVAGLIARGQLREARRLREEQAQPYVVAYAESSQVGEWVIDLVVKNFGATAATGVRVEFDPPLRRAASGEEAVDFPEVIPVLVPQQEWRTFWDTGIARLQSELPDRHVATVCFSDSHERELPPYTFVLDWKPMKAREVITVYGPHHAAKALRELSKEVKTWREGAGGGVSVYARDGDARDERVRADVERRRAARREAEATLGHESGDGTS